MNPHSKVDERVSADSLSKALPSALGQSALHHGWNVPKNRSAGAHFDDRRRLLGLLLAQSPAKKCTQQGSKTAQSSSCVVFGAVFFSIGL